MTLGGTIGKARSAKEIEADALVEAIHDAASLAQDVLCAIGSAWGALRTPSANHVASWRTIGAGMAAIDALYQVPPFASSKEVRAAICAASFCWWGGMGALVKTDVAPLAPAFTSQGSTVH
jgi:hypothetical protein